MPLTSGKTIGAHAFADGSANHQGGTTDLTVTILGPGTFTSRELEVPGLNRLTWVVIQRAGTDSIIIQPQVAFRRGAGSAFVWENILPVSLTNPSSVPLVIPLNTLVCQAMRLVATATGPQGNPACSARFYLSGSA